MSGFLSKICLNLTPEETSRYAWLEGEEIPIEAVDRLLEEAEYEMERQSVLGCYEEVDEAFEEGQESGEEHGRKDERLILSREAEKLRAAADEFLQFVEDRQ